MISIAELPLPLHHHQQPDVTSPQQPDAILASRKISAPESSSARESSQTGVTRTGTRKLFLERCISQEEKQSLKSKPALVRKTSTPTLSSQKSTDLIEEDEFAAKDSKKKEVSKNDSNSAAKSIKGGSKRAKDMLEKMTPKSVTRKISAPARIAPVPPPLPINSIPSTPVIQESGKSGADNALDASLSAIREESGKPSFSKAAKVIHAKVQVRFMLFNHGWAHDKT